MNTQAQLKSVLAPASDIFKYEAAKLHPTQLTVGLKEVHEKQKKLADLSKSERHDFLKERPIPVICGPELQFFLIDHHHLARAVLENENNHVYCYIVEHFNNHKVSHFWKEMDKRNWVYPFDQHGNEKDVTHIPSCVRKLVDDPYRSLAGFARKEEAFIKSSGPFEEFQWANFFRKHIKIDRSDEDFEKALEEALELAQSPSAKHLPGYIGKK